MRTCDHDTLFVVAVLIDDKRKVAHFVMECELCEDRFNFTAAVPREEYWANAAGSGGKGKAKP